MDQLTFLLELEALIAQRLVDRPEDSYTAKLAAQGVARVARKVGEEGVEVALASVTESGERLLEETADLLFHVLLLLRLKGRSLGEVVQRLEARHQRDVATRSRPDFSPPV